MGGSCSTFLNVDIKIILDQPCSDDDNDGDNVDDDYLYNGGRAKGTADRSVSRTQCWISFACDDGDDADDFSDEDEDGDGGADDNDESVKITVVMRSRRVILAMATVKTMMK